jgi:hypothetical protein
LRTFRHQRRRSRLICWGLGLERETGHRHDQWGVNPRDIDDGKLVARRPPIAEIDDASANGQVRSHRVQDIAGIGAEHVAKGERGHFSIELCVAHVTPILQHEGTNISAKPLSNPRAKVTREMVHEPSRLTGAWAAIPYAGNRGRSRLSTLARRILHARPFHGVQRAAHLFVPVHGGARDAIGARRPRIARGLSGASVQNGLRSIQESIHNAPVDAGSVWCLAITQAVLANLVVKRTPTQSQALGQIGGGGG